MTDGSGTWTFGWDSLHRLKSSSRVTSGTTRTVTYSYDLRGLLTSLAYPNSIGTVTRTYDNAGRLSTVTDWLSHTSNFGYDPDGNLTSQTNPNGTSTAITVDDDSRTAAISHAPTSTPGSPFASFTYTRDDIGQLTDVTSTGVPTDNHTWTYNSLNQLSTDTANASAYAYDSGDNLTQLGDGTLQHFNAANQLCWTAPVGSTGTCASAPAGATAYTYDTRGNRIGDTSSSGSHTLGYDYANRLTSYSDGTTTTNYGYNADGLRTSKTSGATTTQFTWDQSSLPLLLVDGTTSYVYDGGGLPLEQINGSTVLYFHHDQLGSTRALTDSTGTAVASYTYDDYGRFTASTGTATNPVTYAGEYRDAESGIFYLRARYYDPATAQFLTRDPIVPATGQAYSYANDDPTNAFDPSGLASHYSNRYRGWDLNDFMELTCEQLEQAMLRLSHEVHTRDVDFKKNKFGFDYDDEDYSGHVHYYRKVQHMIDLARRAYNLKGCDDLTEHEQITIDFYRSKDPDDLGHPGHKPHKSLFQRLFNGDLLRSGIRFGPSVPVPVPVPL